MNRTPIARLTLWLALGSTWAYAQPEPALEPLKPTLQSALQSERAAQSAAVAAPDDAAVSADPAADSPPGGGPPDDYQASEQISEDLSVSFPVDI